MKLLEKLKALFVRDDIPEEAKSAFENAETTKDLLKSLDLVLTKNEIEFNDLKKEIDRVDSILRDEEAKIKESSIDGRQKRYTLQYIKRLRSHLDNLDNRMTIYDKNINLHINLIGRIQDIEAMSLRGVDENQIDKIILDFETHLSRYQDVVRAGETGFESTTNIARREDMDLAELEKEITGADPAAKDRRNRKAVGEAKPEPPAAEKAAEEPDAAEDEEEEGGEIALE